VVEWRAALRTAFPDIAPKVAVARNVTALRTIGWMLARMANIALQDDPFVDTRKYVHFRRWLQEVAVTLVGAPSELEDADVEGRGSAARTASGGRPPRSLRSLSRVPRPSPRCRS
jgi:hypothetical protein